jgi:hypothetical protein
MAGRREKSSRHHAMETVMAKKPAAQERMCEAKNAGIFWRSYRTRHGKQSSNVSSEIWQIGKHHHEWFQSQTTYKV